MRTKTEQRSDHQDAASPVGHERPSIARPFRPLMSLLTTEQAKSL